MMEKIIPELQVVYGHRFDRNWLLRDGALAHRRLLVKEYLLGTFHRRIIGVSYDIERSPRSSDFTPCDFFLWCHLKGRVFTKSLTDLGTRITT